MVLLVPPHKHTVLLPAWRASGFALGFAPTLLLGPPALFATVRSVESFVEQHYGVQIRALKEDGYEGDGCCGAAATERAPSPLPPRASSTAPPRQHQQRHEQRAELIRLLELCCADEVHHKEEAAARLAALGVRADGLLVLAWGWVVEVGSAVAAELARRL